MTRPNLLHQPGVLVLGMHRSGTSVVSGLLDGLGLDAGPTDLLFRADEFNRDGYWEHRPLVALDDVLLRRRGGFASAPPPPIAAVTEEESSLAHESIADMLSVFDGPWFLKDPRQCLLLPIWTDVLGTSDLAVVVNRDPRDVIRSLQHRNGYRRDLAAGLWEVYVRSLIDGLGARPCHFIQYEQLIDDPATATADLARALDTHLGLSDAPGRVESASSLVRSRDSASSSTETARVEDLPAGQQPLADYLASLDGTHEHFDPVGLPAPSGVGASAISRRRW